MKTSLLVTNDSRDEARDSDSWGTNVLLDAEVPATATKRPGLTLTYDGTSPGQGVFIWPDSGGLTVVSVEDDELTFPVVVDIGDEVDGWYAMVENPPTSPGPDDPYWSATPPGSSRYMIACTTYDDYSTHYCTMSVRTTSPVKDQVLSQKAASIAAACKSIQRVIAAARGLIVWRLDSQTLVPPTPVYTVYRFYPTSLPYNVSGTIYADNGYLGSQTGIDWSAGYVPAQTAVPTTPYGFAGAYTIGPVKSEHSHSSISITSTGSVARIAAADIGLTAGAYYLSQVRYIEVSGANEAEYNGTFIGWITTDDLQTKADFINDMNDGWMYYQMSGTPSSATATGTIVVKSYY